MGFFEDLSLYVGLWNVLPSLAMLAVYWRARGNVRAFAGPVLSLVFIGALAWTWVSSSLTFLIVFWLVGCFVAVWWTAGYFADWDMHSKEADEVGGSLLLWPLMLPLYELLFGVWGYFRRKGLPVKLSRKRGPKLPPSGPAPSWKDVAKEE